MNLLVKSVMTSDVQKRTEAQNLKSAKLSSVSRSCHSFHTTSKTECWILWR